MGKGECGEGRRRKKKDEEHCVLYWVGGGSWDLQVKGWMEKGEKLKKNAVFLHGTVGWLIGTLYQLKCGNYGDNQNAVG